MGSKTIRPVGNTQRPKQRADIDAAGVAPETRENARADPLHQPARGFPGDGAGRPRQDGRLRCRFHRVSLSRDARPAPRPPARIRARRRRIRIDAAAFTTYTHPHTAGNGRLPRWRNW
ncbi:hypothetical protein GCM10007886_13230 [Methylobacterium gregans]|nr:hypothetical protein GCM10007886_13230 [Methylobacterium gregans]